MFAIDMTLNGKPYSEVNFEDMFEKSVIQGVVEKITEAISSVLTAEEAAKITLNFRGAVSGGFGVEINGPDDIVAKATAALNGE